MSTPDLPSGQSPAETRRITFSKVERSLEVGLFSGRWLQTPVYIGLIFAVGMVVIKFIQELVHSIPGLLDMSDTELVMLVLSLIDLSLAGNLLLMVSYAGYESFISKLHHEPNDQRPDWMGKVDFSGLKLKILSSIVAISAIHLLRSFIDMHSIPKEEVAWQLAVHLGFVVSGVFLAVMDYIIALTHALEKRK